MEAQCVPKLSENGGPFQVNSCGFFPFFSHAQLTFKPSFKAHPTELSNENMLILCLCQYVIRVPKNGHSQKPRRNRTVAPRQRIGGHTSR